MTADIPDDPARQGGGPRDLKIGAVRGVVLIALALLLIWSVILQHLSVERSQLHNEAIKDAENLSEAYAENMDRTIQGIDQTLRFIQIAYKRDPSSFDLWSWSRDHTFLNDADAQISIIGADGWLRMTNLHRSPKPVDLSDRLHFRTHLKNPTDFMYISAPIIGRVSGKSTVQFTRKIFDKNGAFDGVAVISFSTEYLSHLYSAITLGVDGSISLVGEDGVVRARAPAAGTIGRAAPDMLVGMKTAPGSGHFESSGDVDKVARIYGYTRLTDYPLEVVVGLSRYAVFGPYRKDRLIYLSIATILSLAVLGVGSALSLQHHRLVRSRRALQATLDTISQGIMMIDGDGRVVIMNRRAMELLDLPPELVALHPRFQDLVEWQLGTGEFGTATPEIEAARGSSTQSLIGPTEPMYERTRPNGTVLEIRTHLLADGGGVRTFTDITERRTTERALATARDAAEAGARARSEFLAVMSHEIRTPLNGIIGSSGLLLDMELGPAERQYAQIIRDSGTHLLDLINDILDFSRLEAGRVILEQINFSILELIQGTLDMAQPAAQAKSLRLTSTITQRVPPMLRGDPSRLRQILINLLSNAVKFTEAGSVDVAVDARPADQDTLHLHVTVTDTGVGISPDAVKTLFREFSQVDGSIARRFGGSGLGLAICRRLVTQMGGTIEVRSEPGKGSTFSFEIVLRQADPNLKALPSPQLDATPTRRILVAEDNATNRLVVTRMLERLGHVVRAVESGEVALDALTHEAYDLVLMDVMMPGIDGLAATRAIRALPSPMSVVPIIGLTASTAPEDAEACQRAGMDNFASKPVTAQRLSQVIEATFAEIAARRSIAA